MADQPLATPLPVSVAAPAPAPAGGTAPSPGPAPARRPSRLRRVVVFVGKRRRAER